MLHHPVRVLQGGRVVAHTVVQQRKAKVHQEAGHYGHPVHQGPGLALNGNVQHLDAEARGANGGSKLPDVHVAVIVHLAGVVVVRWQEGRGRGQPKETHVN